MKKVRVYGKTTVWVSVEIETDSDDIEDIKDQAYNEFGGVFEYAGNGGVNKLVGVSGENEGISCGYEEVEFAPNGIGDIEILD